ncbi:MAG: hypothetical protein ACSLEL_02455 [Candidatus Malihini olakiniferum]
MTTVLNMGHIVSVPSPLPKEIDFIEIHFCTSLYHALRASSQFEIERVVPCWVIQYQFEHTEPRS